MLSDSSLIMACENEESWKLYGNQYSEQLSQASNPSLY